MTVPASAPAPASASAERPTWWSIQYLRGLAAAGVVIYHVYATFPAPTGRSFEIGARGVDVFFVISGFIMYSAARDECFVQFVTRRLIRVFPLYWLATVLALLVYFGFDDIRPSGTETVLSLALFPHYSETHLSEIWPILIPGWTLSYELLFYALFALGIAARRVVAVPVLAIAALVTLGLVLKPQLAPLIVATSPLLIEFLLGLFIARALHRRPALLPGIVLAALAVSLGGAALGADTVAIYAGAAAIVSGALWLERRRPGHPVAELRLLGDASYSIYLFHIPFLFVVERAIGDSLDGASLTVVNAVALTAVVASLAFGILIHLTLEKPLLRILNGWNRRLLAPAAPVTA